MKPRPALMSSNSPTLRVPEVPVPRRGFPRLLLGMAALAALSLSGCVVTGVGYEDPGYYPYSGPYYGPYYGDYGPYPWDLGYGGIYRGGHHFAGSSFGRGGVRGRVAQGPGGVHGGGARSGGGHPAGAHGPRR